MKTRLNQKEQDVKAEQDSLYQFTTQTPYKAFFYCPTIRKHFLYNSIRTENFKKNQKVFPKLPFKEISTIVYRPQKQGVAIQPK